MDIIFFVLGKRYIPMFSSGTEYYPYGDLPDTSDTYEWGGFNRWNTDQPSFFVI